MHCNATPCLASTLASVLHRQAASLEHRRAEEVSPMNLQPTLSTRVKRGWRAGPVRLFRWLTKALSRGFFAVVHWCAGLRLGLLLQGLPALVVGTVAVVVLVQAALTPAQRLETRYLEHAQASAKAKNHEESLVCYERLADMQSDRPEILYEMAQACEAAGQTERCLLLMGRLAPADRPGGY